MVFGTPIAYDCVQADVGGQRREPTTRVTFLLFPTGPFVGEVADTIVNFAPETRIEDAQK